MADHPSYTPAPPPGKPVHVCSYERMVEGKLQNVCTHFRSLPNTAANDACYGRQSGNNVDE